MEQQVKRRKKPAVLFRTIASRQQTGRSGVKGVDWGSSSVNNANIIRHIKQKPVHTYRKLFKRTSLTFSGKKRFAFPGKKPFTFPAENFFILFEKGLFKKLKRIFAKKGLLFSFSVGNTIKDPAGRAEFQSQASSPGARSANVPERVPVSRLSGFPLAPVLVAFVVLVFSIVILNWESPSLTLLLEGPPDIREDSNSQRNLAVYAGLSPMAAPAPVEEEIPLDLAEVFSWESYQVRPGDSVSKIAAAHAISMDAIIASNSITNARRLQVGETLRIPNMDGIPYTVKSGDNLLKISISMGVPLEAILDANDIQNDNIVLGTVLFIPGARMKKEDLKLALGELFIYPIKGRLTSPFGWRNDPISGVQRHHAALDLAAGMGTPVKASMDGKVSVVGLNATYGKYIILSHTNGFQTMYAHLSLTSVTPGAMVIQGSKIGEVGSTGYSTGPHLHFAIYKNGRAVNPLELLTK